MATLPFRRYMDRPWLVLFLHSRVYRQGHKNVLEDFLYVTMRTSQYA